MPCIWIIKAGGGHARWRTGNAIATGMCRTSDKILADQAVKPELIFLHFFKDRWTWQGLSVKHEHVSLAVLFINRHWMHQKTSLATFLITNNFSLRQVQSKSSLALRVCLTQVSKSHLMKMACVLFANCACEFAMEGTVPCRWRCRGTGIRLLRCSLFQTCCFVNEAPEVDWQVLSLKALESTYLRSCSLHFQSSSLLFGLTAFSFAQGLGIRVSSYDLVTKGMKSVNHKHKPCC